MKKIQRENSVRLLKNVYRFIECGGSLEFNRLSVFSNLELLTSNL
jgi:hypothetical protein